MYKTDLAFTLMNSVSTFEATLETLAMNPKLGTAMRAAKPGHE